MPAQGTPVSTPRVGNVNHGPWSYNDVVHIVTHDGRVCKTCSAWALHYMMSACNHDKTLRQAKDLHDNAIRAPLAAEIATLREANESLRRELDWARDDLARLRRKDLGSTWRQSRDAARRPGGRAPAPQTSYALSNVSMGTM